MDPNIATFAQGQPGQGATPGLSGTQYSTYPYQVPNGQGGLAAYYAASQPLFPSAWFGNLHGQMAQPIGGAFGNPQIGSILGGWGGQLPNFIAASAAAQGFPQIPQQIYGYNTFGPQAWGIPGTVAGWYPTQQPLAAQGWLGSPIGQPAQLAGYGMGGVLAYPQFGGYLGAFGNPFYGSIPFSASPQATQAAQQASQAALQVAQQGTVQAAHQAAHVAQQVAQQGAIQAAQAAQHVAHQVAVQTLQAAQELGHQVAVQAAQQVGQQALQVAQQVTAACLGQQMYSPLNPLAVPWASLQPWGNLYGIPQAIRPLNPFAGAPLGNPTQLVAQPRFSFA